jgi:UDP-N-acetyl-D-glucosamine dehydrogenase
MTSLEDLSTRIASKAARIGIFGAGYVGLPLACAFAEAGFDTVACDSDLGKVLSIRSGISYLKDKYTSDMLPSLINSGRLSADNDISHVAALVDFDIITVPTPLNHRNQPDLSYLVKVCEEIAETLESGRFVILESSVYPGTTDEVVRPILERKGLVAGKDFGLAHSPERIDYGENYRNMKSIPKVVGGVTPLLTRIAAKLYTEGLKAHVVPVSDARTAEATKMLENTYRYVNIALVNELAILHERLGIDFFEVVAAASTKPFGFQAFYPGPGVGGHCIPKDPHYLSYKARQVGQRLRLIELSAEINDMMIDHILERLATRLRARGEDLRRSKVAILGLAFKQDVDDTRNSPSIRMSERLRKLGVQLSAYDPFVREVKTEKWRLMSAETLESAVEGAQVLVLLTPHTAFRQIDLKKLARFVRPGATIVDTRGFWSPSECISAGFDYVGLGRPDCDLA